MSHTTRSIFDANPATFDATQEVVSIGDLIVDPAGVNPPRIVTGPNSARTVQPLGSVQPPNTVTPTQTSTGVGNRRIALLVKDFLGAPIVGGPVNLALQVSPTLGATADVIVGAGVLVEQVGVAVTSWVGFAITSAAGLVTLKINGTAGDAVDLIYGNGGTTGVVNATIP